MRKLSTLLHPQIFDAVHNTSAQLPLRFEDIISSPPNLPILRFMVDPLNGDDTNDGTTWATAFKSLYQAASVIPSDLGNRQAVILMHPGEHLVEEGKTPTIDSSNGAVHIVWVGTFINESENNTDIRGYYSWARNGASNPIRNDDQARLKFAPGVTDTWTILDFIGDINQSLKISFSATDFNYNWNQVGCFYWDKFAIEGYSSRSPVEYPALINASGVTFLQDGSFTLDLKTTKVASFFENCGGHFSSLKLIGGDGDATHNTSNWRGIIHCGEGSSVTVQRVPSGYAVGFEPPNALFDVTYFRSNLATVYDQAPNSKLIVLLPLASDVYLDNSSLGNQNFRITLADKTKPGSIIIYNNSVIDLIDYSSASRLEEQYDINDNLVYSRSYATSSQPIFNLPTSDPVETGALWNDAGIVKVSSG